MVRKLAQLLFAPVRGLHEAAYLLAGFALLSQLLALIRDRLFAHQFGAGEILDTYYAAFKIPDFLFVSIASLVSIYVLIPFLTESIEHSQEKTRELLNSVFTGFAVTLIGVSIVVFFAAPWLLKILFPGFEGAQFENLVLLTRILLLQPLFLGISNLIASVTQIKGRFILYATSPLLYNLGIIIGAVVLYPAIGIMGLAWGVVFGAMMHLLLQVPFVIKEGLLPRVTFKPDVEVIKRVIAVSLPRTMTLAANQLTLLVFIAMASLLTAGSVSVFQFALNLQSVPLAIIGVSYSVAAFPTLARLFASGKRDEYVEQVANAARHIIFWSLPALALVIVLRAQMVRVILGSGEFDWSDTRLTAAALALFVISLTAQALTLLLVRGYYAAGNTIKPFAITIVSAFSSIALAFGLLRWFEENAAFSSLIETMLRVEGIEGTIVLMLPLAFTIGMLLNALALLIFFQKDHGTLGHVLRPVFFKTTIAALFGGAAAHRTLAFMDQFVDMDTFWGIFIQGFVAGVVGIIAIIVALYVTKSDELKEFWKSVHHKFWRTRTVVPEDNN